MIRLHASWHELEPQAGHDAMIEEFQALLVELRGQAPDAKSVNEGREDG